jgi:hypothetical protein
MLIGILSDSHDDMERIQKAVDLFNARGASHIIHAGDIISPFTFEVFSGLKGAFSGVFGNNDGDRVLLAEKSGGTLHAQPHLLTVGGKRIVVVHEPDIVTALAESGRFDLVVYGHTHKPQIRKMGNALVVNPGKAARLHKGDSTVALLDTETMEAEIVRL